MRIFVHYDKQGQIISVVQIESLGEGLEHPFLLDEKSGGVLELKADDPAASLPLLEIHEGFVVNVDSKKIERKP
jgi:hypothetical protein